MAQSNFDRPAETVTALQQNISEQFGAASMGDRGPDRGHQAKESVQVVAQNFKGALDRSIKEQPMATVALAAAAAFVLGAIWKA